MNLEQLFPLKTLPRRSARLLRKSARVYGGRTVTKPIDFAIVGTMRGGSTALDAHLRGHPDICMADQKEVHFFDNEWKFRGGKPNYAFYHANFSPRPGHKALGEATPGYMYWPTTPERLQAYNPALKTILILRNPIERAYSHWNKTRARGDDPETLPFWEALQREAERTRKPLSGGFRRYSYVDRGRYAAQLERLWRYFPREQSLVFKTEDLSERPQETLDRVFEFLGVSPHVCEQRLRRNDGDYETPMSDRERTYLQDVFEPEIRALEKLLGWDCTSWVPSRVPKVR